MTRDEIIKAAEELADRINRHVSTMASHIRNRKSAMLLDEAANRLHDLIELVPGEGMVVVPEEPTQDMLEAGNPAIIHLKEWDKEKKDFSSQWGKAIYKAMLKAVKEKP